MSVIVLANPVGWSCPARADDAVFPFPIRRSVLDNGLTVISVKYDSPGIIAYYTVVRTGSRNEVEPGLSGFAHFFEHMMFRGTPRFSEGKYNEVLKGLGADSNAFTTDDWTCYHATVSADALDIARREDAGHGFHAAHLQAHDHRLSQRHRGYAEPI
jgi:predicted Zn-dependent peptidase